MVILDKSNNILRATKNISLWFNIKGKEILGKNINDYIDILDSTPVEKLKNTEIKIKGYTEDIFEASTIKLQLKDKKKRNILIIKNITNQKEMELLKENFVATLAHDLKVPIIAETNILDFLLSEKFGPISEKRHEVINNIQDSNKELIELVQILPETYKVKDTGMQLYFETFVV